MIFHEAPHKLRTTLEDLCGRLRTGAAASPCAGK